jgi:hypothetical protein
MTGIVCRFPADLIWQVLDSWRGSMTGDISVITEEIRSAGFGFAPAEQFRALLTPAALAEWLSFAASWENLGVDTYTADGGRYRRRRFAAFAVSSEGIVRNRGEEFRPSVAHRGSCVYR